MALRIYYYPNADGPLKIVSCARLASVLHERPEPALSWQHSLGGGLHASRGTVLRRVELEYVFPGPDMSSEWAEIDAVANHLQRGGMIGLAREPEYAFAGLTTGMVSGGTTAIPTGGNAFGAWSGSATLSSARLVRLENGAGYDQAESCVVTSYSSGSVTLTNGARFAYPGTVLVRDPDFWPALVLDPAASGGVDILRSSTRRLTWTLAGVLTYSPSLAMEVAAGGSATGPEVAGQLWPELAHVAPNWATESSPQWGAEDGPMSLERARARVMARPRVTRSPTRWSA